MKKQLLATVLCFLLLLSGTMSAFATNTELTAAMNKIKDLRISPQAATSIAHRVDPVTGEFVLDRNTLLPESTLNTLKIQLESIVENAATASPQTLNTVNEYLVYLQNTALKYYDNFNQIEALYREAITATTFDFSNYVTGDGSFVVEPGSSTPDYLDMITDGKFAFNDQSSTYVAPDTSKVSATSTEDFAITAPNISFSDVTKDTWFYTQVMEMAKIGLFKGKGNNLFCPNDTMTGAEFLTVVMRILFPNADLSSAPGQSWWRGAYNQALIHKILQNEFSVAEAEDPLQRQKMASIVVNALDKRGETLSEYNKDWIPDYSIIFKEYGTDVCKAYGAGILVGDDKYFFNPQKTLTRAEASTVLYRMIEPSARANTDNIPLEIKQQFAPGTPYPITIYEGQKRYNRPAKEGDTFVKADGTKIVLQKDQYGIVGGGQGLAPDVGLSMGFDICTLNQRFGYDVSEFGVQTDSTGNSINNSTYFVNRTTGEAHWSDEWQHLSRCIPAPSHKGKEGEVSTDAYALYRWSDAGDLWTWNK